MNKYEEVKSLVFLILKRNYGIEDASANARLKEDLGLLEINILEMFLALESHYDINVNDHEIDIVSTVEEIIKTVELQLLYAS